ncbi:C40 family peptidase, partial [Crossiella equi]
PPPVPAPAPAPDADALAAQALDRVADAQRRRDAVAAGVAKVEHALRTGEVPAARALLTALTRLCAQAVPEPQAVEALPGWAGVVTESADRLQREHLRQRAELCTGLPELDKRLAEAVLRQRVDRVAASMPTLRAGTRDTDAVAQVKTMLNGALGAKLSPVNPSYGPSTTAAVRAFQAAKGLPVTGRVDRLTWRELFVAHGGVPATGFAFGPARAPSERAALAVRAALTQLGLPYEWGAVKPGESFDCSGLTSWAYRQAGVTLPRHSTHQAIGSPVTRENLRPGDLIVWEGHVAMYVDRGRMIEAGDPIRLTAVRTTNVGMPFLGFFRPTA